MLSQVYLDFNATTPVHPLVRDSVFGTFDFFGNPSSIHWAGRNAKRVISKARESFANFVGVEPLEVIWTAGGSS